MANTHAHPALGTITTTTASDHLILDNGPPRPLKALDGYDEARIRKGREYALAAIAYNDRTHQFSPMSKIAVAKYLDACETGLSVGSHKLVREAAIKDMQYFEGAMCERTSMWKASPKNLKGASDNLKGNRLFILKKYGDYCAKFWEEVKKFCAGEAEDHGLLFPKSIKNKLVTHVDSQLEKERHEWAPLYQQLQDEAPAWGESEKKGVYSGVGVHYTLWQISNQYNVPLEYLMAMIQMDAERNKEFYNPMQQCITNGKRGDLAELLWNDWHWAHNNWPIDDKESRQQQMMILWYLQFKLERWFNLNPRESTPTEDWDTVESTKELASMMEKARPKTSAEREAAGKANTEEMAKEDDDKMSNAVAKALFETEDFYKMLLSRAFADNNESLPSSSPPQDLISEINTRNQRLPKKPTGGDNGEEKENENNEPSSSLNPPNPANYEKFSRRDAFDMLMAKRKNVTSARRALKAEIKRLITLQQQFELEFAAFRQRFHSNERGEDAASDHDSVLGQIRNLQIDG